MPIFPNPYSPMKKKPDPLADLARQRAGAGTKIGAPPAVGNASNTRPAAPAVAPPVQDPRAAAVDAAKQKSASQLAANGGTYNPRQGAISQMASEHDAEQKATMQQLAASRARQLQDAASRSNLGGFGLSGAAQGLEGDTANAADRNATLALADLHHKQHDEDFQAIQRQAALDDIEASENRDVDRDGLVAGQKVGGGIGDGNPDDFVANGDNATQKTVAGDNGATHKVNVFDAPVTDAQRIDITGAGYDVSHIVDGSFQKGSLYFGSDAAFDYYQGPDGNFYRVAR
jgi:hypothetical protein